MGLDALQSVVCAAVADSLACRLPPRARHFWRLPCGLPGGTGPRSLARTGSSSRELLLPFRVLAAPTPPAARRRQAPVSGFVPHRDTSPQSPLMGRATSPAITFRPRRFSRPRRLAPPRALQACFIPQPRPGFTLQGFLSAVQPDHLVDGPCPLVVDARHLPQPKPRRRPPDTRLQGLDPNSDSKPLGRWFRPAEARSPPVFSLPRALLRAPCSRLHGHSARDLRGECSLSTQPLVLSVSVGARPGDPSLDHPPVRDFQPAFQPDRSRTFQRGPTYQAARYDRRTVAGNCRRRATRACIHNLRISQPAGTQGDVATPGQRCEEALDRLCRGNTVRYVRVHLMRRCLLSGHFLLLSREWSTTSREGHA